MAHTKTSTTHQLQLESQTNTPSNQKPKTMLIQVEGELTDESLLALYQTSRGYPTAAVTIVDLSAVTGSAVSCDFIRKFANRKAAIADIDSLLFIVAPQPYLYGLCRMFQTLREGRLPMSVIVHTLDEAFVALGIEPPHFEPLAVSA